ncbi:sensor histidine kinase [Fulvivirga sediminis]|uniref:histidine kinase n=1 Tax=Fulvivirga sediminis TaxID=2803949 RepID=A0A937F5H7_9BACT|nr:sensor histidine kinase [Fulvivirga sediminis]MBL3654690.1 sensor histidine kinase [Fulvivirga sediminis]
MAFKPVIIFWSVLLNLVVANGVVAQHNRLVLREPNSVTDLTPYLRYWNINGDESLEEALTQGNFVAFERGSSLEKSQWISFTIENQLEDNVQGKINFTFTDWVDFYILNESNLLIRQAKSGDLFNVNDRPVKSGLMVFHNIEIPAKSVRKVYVKLKSTTDISYQFKKFTLKSIKLYAGDAYYLNFDRKKIFQALFYGALFIMFFYNFFLFTTLRSASYLYYVIFLFFLILFFSSNSGYLTDYLLMNSPRVDLYIRFLSPAFVTFTYLAFARSFLQTNKRNRKLSKATLVMMILQVLLVLIMFIGFWKLGRTLVIISAATSFLLIFILAIKNIRRGFTPARYFMAANAFFLVGGIVFALERLSGALASDMSQYAVQIGILLEVALLSIGLAERINVIKNVLAQQTLENERLETRRAEERRKIIQQKNKQLEKSYQELDTFIYKTAHDIKGPLARLLGLSNLALMEVKEKKARAYFNMFYNDSQYLNRILSRLSSVHDVSVARVEPVQIDVNSLIEQLVKENKLRLEAFSVKMRCQDSLYVYSDYNLLKFALSDLLDNAIKFIDTTKEKHTIEINALQDEEVLEINIVDNGIGIREDDIPSLFEMFTRSAAIHGNVGLGLYMVKMAVSRVGGRVMYVANQSNFAYFKIIIPIHYSSE